jgi:Methyltransferase domain
MNQLLSLVRLVLPPQIRSQLRQIHRDFVFKRAMKHFIKDPSDCTQPGNKTLNDLIYGWGNESWSALDEYLACCIDHALNTQGSVLECGSGLSTLLLGAVAKKRGHQHWALEHTPEWTVKVQKYLDNYQLDSVILSTKPLRDYGDFSWYDAPLEKMPANFCLVICDGPPANTKGGRHGLIPIMKDRLTSGCVILLDDAGRKEEVEIATRWGKELNSSFNIEGISKPYIKMVVV